MGSVVDSYLLRLVRDDALSVGIRSLAFTKKHAAARRLRYHFVISCTRPQAVVFFVVPMVHHSSALSQSPWACKVLSGIVSALWPQGQRMCCLHRVPVHSHYGAALCVGMSLLWYICTGWICPSLVSK